MVRPCKPCVGPYLARLRVGCVDVICSIWVDATARYPSGLAGVKPSARVRKNAENTTDASGLNHSVWELRLARKSNPKARALFCR